MLETEEADMVALDRLDGGSRLRLRGRVTIVSAQPLHAAALRALEDSGDVEVDASEATYLDTAAAQVLLALALAVRERQRSFRLVSLAPSVADLLRIAGLDLALGIGGSAPIGEPAP